MTQYGNITRKSGIKSYEIGDNYIIVEFEKPTNSGKHFYKYVADRVGQRNIEIMHDLARQGAGLNSFIGSNEEIKYSYSISW